MNLITEITYSVTLLTICDVTFVFDIHVKIKVFSLFGHQLLPKYEKSLKLVVFVCGKEATPGFWVGSPSCGGTVSR